MNKRNLSALLLSLSILGGCAAEDPLTACEIQCAEATACQEDSTISCEAACDSAVVVDERIANSSARYGCESQYLTYATCRGSVGLEGAMDAQNPEGAPLCIDFADCTEEHEAFMACMDNSPAAQQRRTTNHGSSGGSSGGSRSTSGEDLIRGIMGAVIGGGFLGF